MAGHDVHPKTHTHTQSRRHDMYQSLFYKACLKRLPMTCHKACFSRHGEKVEKRCQRNLYSVKSSNGIEPYQESNVWFNQVEINWEQ